MDKLKRTTVFLQEFSIPLIIGVFAALFAANMAPHWYHHAIHWAPFGEGAVVFGHTISIHFLINDIFMVFFFGIAAKEITESILPGGDLNPPSKAINPLMATLGGVFGPIGIFFLGLTLCYSMGIYPEELRNTGLERGWGIPTATDIALAWLVARTVFGKGHPAINFLLLLAVADDAIGLGIIAVFYGDPENPAKPIFLGLVLLGMGIAFALRKMKIQAWPAYIFLAGPVAWSGLMLAHLHPALALVFIVPFLPGPTHDTGLFSEEDEIDQGGHDAHGGHEHSPLHQFEHQLKLMVDFGLFFFAFANAGVALEGIGTMSWLIFGSLVVGKTLGVSIFSMLASKMGYPLPNGMNTKDLIMAGFIAALGLTVALFVSGEAFQGALQGEAKMGALFSGFVGVAAVILGRVLGVGNHALSTDSDFDSNSASKESSVI